MQTGHSLTDLVDFLNHADTRGLMPTATAQALAVAVRNVFGVLDPAEQAALPLDDVDGVIRRFENKRARDFSPSSLKEYGRRVLKATTLYERWKKDPAGFSVKTRATSAQPKNARSKPKLAQPDSVLVSGDEREPVTAPAPLKPSALPTAGSVYESAFPVRPGHVVAIANIPSDMTSNEAERLAVFVRMLGTA